MTLLRRAALISMLLSSGIAVAGNADDCSNGSIRVQVLGSGTDDFIDGRAGSGYVVWIDGKARLLVDIGPAAAMRFLQSGARTDDLDVVLLSHLHVDTTADLPTLIATAMRERRSQPLPLYGPSGNQFAPSTVTFVRSLLDDTRGAYRYLGSVLSPLNKDGFKLEAYDVRQRASAIGARRDNENKIIPVYTSPRYHVTAIPVIHGVYPALAWSVQIGNRRIVFSGDNNGEGGNLERLAKGADLLIAPLAIAEGTGGIERYLHMPPSVIGRIAERSGVKRVALTHRTQQTRQAEEALNVMRTHYHGAVAAADDLDCFVVQ